MHEQAVLSGDGDVLQASLYCMERFHHSLAEEMAKAFGVGYTTDMWDAKWDEVMKATFLKVDKDVGGICPNEIYNDDDNANSNSNDDDNANSNSNDDDIVDASCSCCVDAIAPENVGTTAVVAIIGSSQIVVGNCGDSRAVLARGNTAMPLSRDHKVQICLLTCFISAA
jgi:protein phosphatase 2C